MPQRPVSEGATLRVRGGVGRNNGRDGEHRCPVRKPAVPARHLLCAAVALRSGLRAFRLRQSGRAQGRRHARAADGHVRQLQCHHRDRPARRRLRRHGKPGLRPVARRQHRRARKRLRAARGRGRRRGGLPLDRLPPARERPLARRRAGHARRCAVHLRHHPGARLRRPAHGARRPRTRLQVRRTGDLLRHPRRRRAEPHPAVRLRPHRDPAAALLGDAGHHEDHGDGTAWQRALPAPAGGIRSQPRTTSAWRTTGDATSP